MRIGRATREWTPWDGSGSAHVQTWQVSTATACRRTPALCQGCARRGADGTKGTGRRDDGGASHVGRGGGGAAFRRQRQKVILESVGRDGGKWHLEGRPAAVGGGPGEAKRGVETGPAVVSRAEKTSSGSRGSRGAGSGVMGAGFSPQVTSGWREPHSPSTGWTRVWRFPWGRSGRRGLAAMGKRPAPRRWRPQGRARTGPQLCRGPGGAAVETAVVERGPSLSRRWLVGSRREKPSAFHVSPTL